MQARIQHEAQALAMNQDEHLSPFPIGLGRSIIPVFLAATYSFDSVMEREREAA
jgi:hypothetical protein